MTKKVKIAMMLICITVNLLACGKNNNLSETISIKKQIIYSENNIEISAENYKKTDTGFYITLTFNNTSTSDILISLNNYAINGIMVDEYDNSYRINIPAGESISDELLLKGSLLNNEGISTVKCIDLSFITDQFDTGLIEIKSDLYDGNHDEISGMDIYNKNDIDIDYLCIENGVISIVAKNNSIEDIKLNINNVLINKSESVLVPSVQIFENSSAVIEIESNAKELESIVFDLNYMSENGSEITVENIQYEE